MVKRRLPIGPACRAVSGVGQNDRRRRCPRGLLVHATRALQTRLDGRPDADSDRDKDMLVIVDQDIELFPGDGALLDADTEGLLQGARQLQVGQHGAQSLAPVTGGPHHRTASA